MKEKHDKLEFIKVKIIFSAKNVKKMTKKKKNRLDKLWNHNFFLEFIRDLSCIQLGELSSWSANFLQKEVGHNELFYLWQSKEGRRGCH